MIEGNTRLRRRMWRAGAAGLIGGLLFVLLAPSARPVLHAEAAPLPKVVQLHPTAAAPIPLDLADPPQPQPAHAPGRWAIPSAEIDLHDLTVQGPSLVQTLADGTHVTTTLDPMLQRAAKAALARYKVEYGVVVALRPSTGEILALAEHAELRPELRHLALQAEGPAASLFKVVTAAALLELGGLTPEDAICTHGGKRALTMANLRPHARRDTRCETLGQALGSSNNVAFARWSDQGLRPAQLQAVADRFLFNRRLPFLWGVALSEARVPTGSRLGFARSAAGFEGSSLSPLHAAMIMGAVANDGVMMAPRLVAEAERGGVSLYRNRATALTRVVQPETARALRAMMVETTTSGSAKKFFERDGRPRLPVKVAAKTGSLSSRRVGLSRHYSWFIAAAPADNPEIAIASLVVNGETWTTKGAIPARELLEHYFQRQATGPKGQPHE